MINLKDYNEKKEKGLISLVKAGDSFATATKKFDAEDGADLPDEVVGVSMKELTDRKETLKLEIAEIDAFIEDCEVLNVQEEEVVKEEIKDNVKEIVK